MHTVAHDELTRVLRRLYEAVGTPSDVAVTVSELQVEASLVGHDSHGVMKTADYIACAERGDVVPDATPVLVSETTTTGVIDGNWGFGFAVTSWATALAIEKAKSAGIAAFTIRRQGHIGRLGAYATRIAEAGLIGVITADSGAGPKSALPYGGRERRLGTNPLSIAVAGTERIVCLDMATTAVAIGKLNVARNRGERIPTGWILDGQGRPTNDPEDYFAGGGLLPLGADAGHKGYGLAVMVEILSGVLTGIGFGVDPSGRHNDGSFLLAVDVERFRPGAEFRREIDDFVEFLKETPPADGFDAVLYPGELEERTKAERMRTGVPVDLVAWEQLCVLCSRFGIPHAVALGE